MYMHPHPAFPGNISIIVMAMDFVSMCAVSVVCCSSSLLFPEERGKALFFPFPKIKNYLFIPICKLLLSIIIYRITLSQLEVLKVQGELHWLGHEHHYPACENSCMISYVVLLAPVFCDIWLTSRRDSKSLNCHHFFIFIFLFPLIGFRGGLEWHD